MPQGWQVSDSANSITFLEAPATGVNNIVVTQYAAAGTGGTSAFALGAWSGQYGYPSEVEFFSDRLWFASSVVDPQVIWGSQIGDYTNFGKSTPIVDSDAVTFAINTRQVNKVMDLVPLDKMIVLAKGGEFLMTGGQDDVVTPSTIAIKPQSYRGTGGLQAKVVGDTAIFVQEQGNRVYDIGYRFEQDGYRPTDISVWAEHLVEGSTLLRMEWAPAPWSNLWFVRNDGTLIGCTYMPEQEVIGWHRHDTDGEILDIACLPGTAQTEVHVLVKRTINGVDHVYLEQLADSFVGDTRDQVYMDCASTYDGRNTGAGTVTLSGVAWSETDILTLTASAAMFTGASDIGDGLLIGITVPVTDPATGVTTQERQTVRVRITGYTSATVVTVQSIGDVPASLRNVATADWELQRDTMAGLGHLEGKAVAVLADGNVVDHLTVTGGAITLPNPAAVVHVGLPFRGLLRTLEITAPNGEPMRGKKKLISALGLMVKDTRGLKAGTTLRNNEEFVYELPQREFENYDEATRPLTGYGKIPLSGEWGENSGQVYLISDDPLPADVLALLPELMASD